MKKHLIAAAVAAAVAAPAMAQDVQIYGILSTAYSSFDSKLTTGATSSEVSTTNTGLQGAQSGSRIGFRGTEDLGGGMKAGFVYELGVNNNTGLGANRLGYLQAQGSFGTFRAGRVDSLTRSIYNSFTAHGNSGFAPGNLGASIGAGAGTLVAFGKDRDGNFDGRGTDATVTNANANALGCGGFTVSNTNAVTTVVLGGQQTASAAQARANCELVAGNTGWGGTRVADSLGYISPSINGFTFQAQYGVNEVDRSDRASDNSSKTANFGLSYASGPLAVSVARDQVKIKSEAAVNSSDTTFGGFLDSADVVWTAPLVNRSGNEFKVTTDMLGAAYDFGVAKVMFVHTAKKLTLGGFTSAQPGIFGTGATITEDGFTTKIKENTVGVQVPLGAVQLVASYSDGNIKSDGEKTDIEAYQLQANYNLSKRTRLYAMYGESEVKETGLQWKLNGYALGLQHSF
jgi:predicted porin